MELNEIKSALVVWNEMRAITDDALLMLSSGHYFQITRDMYNYWKGKSGVTDIHAYVGVVEVPSQQLNFFLIDDVADAASDFTTIYPCAYQFGFSQMQIIPEFENLQDPERLTTLVALERGFRWMINRENYVATQAPQAGPNAGLFQAFHVPLNDLHTIFHNTTYDSALVVIGMRVGEEPELILWSDNFSHMELVEDVALPIPPFHNNQSNYGLLNSAL